MADQQGSRAMRPESTIVQSFASDLDSMFGLSSAPTGPPVEQLEQTVEEKKQTVTSAADELQRLEAQLRETEQRLAQASRSRGSSPLRQTPSTGVPRSYPDKQASSGASERIPQAQNPTRTPTQPVASRPQNTRGDTATLMAGMPGAMPEAPIRRYSGSNDYIMVDRGSTGGSG